MFWTGIVFSSLRNNANLLFMLRAAFDLIIIKQDNFIQHFMQIRLARIIAASARSIYIAA